MKKAFFAILVVAFVLGMATMAFAVPPTVISTDTVSTTGGTTAVGASDFTYADLMDAADKTEGGYVALSLVQENVTTQVDDQTVVDNTTNVVTTTLNSVYADSPHGGY